MVVELTRDLKYKEVLILFQVNFINIFVIEFEDP